jgi:hypothetical protein
MASVRLSTVDQAAKPVQRSGKKQLKKDRKSGPKSPKKAAIFCRFLRRESGSFSPIRRQAEDV